MIFFLQAMFNGGIRKRVMGHSSGHGNNSSHSSSYGSSQSCSPVSYRGSQESDIQFPSLPERRPKLEEAVNLAHSHLHRKHFQSIKMPSSHHLLKTYILINQERHTSSLQIIHKCNQGHSMVQ